MSNLAIEQDQLFTEKDLSYSELLINSFILLKRSLNSISSYVGIGIINISQMIIFSRQGNNLDIAAFGLGITWINAASFAILMALNDGIRAVSSQAYGSKNYILLGKIYNQSKAITFTLCILTLFLIINSSKMLKFLGINPIIADKTQTFCIWSIPQLLASSYFESTRQFLFAQRIFDVHMKGQLIASFFHPFICYFFIVYKDLGMIGGGLARSMTFIFSIFIVKYQIEFEGKGVEYIQKFDLRDSFQNWGNLLKIAIPAGGTNYLKWFSIEILTVLVGNLPNTNCLTAQSAFSTVYLFCSMFVKGLQAQANTYVSNSVGYGKIKMAQNLVLFSYIANFYLCFMISACGFIFQNQINNVFNFTQDISHQFNIAFKMYTYVDIWCNFLQQVQAGILSGMNRQNDTVILYVINFLVVMFSASYFFSFYFHFELYGIWLGRILAGFLNQICFNFILNIVDLEKEINNVNDNLKIKLI